jgi:hypothetical protein
MMSVNEAYVLDTRLSALKKSLPMWITGLQGTGNMELNQVVNDLHQLIREAQQPAADSASLRQQMSSLYHRIQAIKSHHQEPYRSRLSEVEKELAKLRM